MRLKTGWANLCRNHYEHHISAEAAEFCRSRGLMTLEQKRAYIRERLPAIGARFGLQKLPIRVPGQDDEERST